MFKDFLEMLGPAPEFDRRIVLVAGPNVIRAEILCLLQASDIIYPVCLPIPFLSGVAVFRDAFQRQKKQAWANSIENMEAEILSIVERFAFGSNLSKPPTHILNEPEAKALSRVAVHFDPAFVFPAAAEDGENDTAWEVHLSSIYALMAYWPDAELVILSSTYATPLSDAARVSELLNSCINRARVVTEVPANLTPAVFEALILTQSAPLTQQ